MKRLRICASLALAFLLMLFPLVSCTERGVEDDGKLKIVTTIFPQYDFAREISKYAADEVELTMLLPLGSESHDYEPTLSDLRAVERADLVICVGGETDGWIESVLAAVDNAPAVMKLCDLVPLYPEEKVEGMEEDGHAHHHDEDCDGEHHHTEYDEHVWTSLSNAATITSAICSEMCKARPNLSGELERGADEYTEKLCKLKGSFKKAVEEGERNTLIFADRFPFRYLTEEFGLSYYAAFAGCASDAEPALSTIYFLTEKVREEGAAAVFTIEFSRGEAAELIAEETGAKRLTLHSCHNVSKEDFDGGKTYLQIMEENLEALKEALDS